MIFIKEELIITNLTQQLKHLYLINQYLLV
jgi:hypothetical protein